MTATDWKRALEAADLPEGQPRLVEVGDNTILFLRRGTEVFARCGECTHYGAPLDEGMLHGDTLICPWHDAHFHVPSGKVTAPPALDDLCTYPVKIEAGWVYVAERKPAAIPTPQGDDDRSVVIIGAGAAGNAAAETLRRNGFAGGITMITSDFQLPYDRTMLSKAVLSGAMGLDEAPLRSEPFYSRLGIDVKTRCRARSIDRENRMVRIACEAQDDLPYDLLLLATGAEPIPLQVDGWTLDGIHLLRTVSNAQALVAAAEKAERAVIVGAGFIAMEAAAALTERGLQVDIVAPESVPMEAALGQRVGRRLADIHMENGVRFHLGQRAEAFRGTDRVEAVVTSGGETLQADFVLVGIGVRPAVAFLEGSGLDEDGAVPVDGSLRTKDDRIYAAGDIARYPDPFDGERRRIEHWTHAERQGAHAACAMLGDETPYNHPPFFWTMQFGNSVKYIGYPAESDRQAVRGDLESDTFAVGYYRNNRLHAVCALGMANVMMPAGELFKRRINVPPETFQDASADLADLLPPPA